MNHLVIGEGEVGTALAELLQCDSRDVDDPGTLQSTYDVLHIAIPFQSKTFHKIVADYEELYSPEYLVVHSTVPVGTCDGWGWVHAPVRGKHPDMLDGLTNFTQHYGGHDAPVVAEILKEYFPEYICHTDAAITEAGKLWELTMYGMEIAMLRYVQTYCQRTNLPFHEVYTLFGSTYNDGWETLGQEQFIKPILFPSEGPIGGHCVVPGAKMLNDGYRNLISEVVMAVQAELKGEK